MVRVMNNEQKDMLRRVLAHSARTARLDHENELLMEQARIWRSVEAEIASSPNVYLRRLMESRT